MFKKKRGIKLNYNRQGLIYFTCMNIHKQPRDIQERIMALCDQIAGEDGRALFELLTNDRKSVLSVSMEYIVPEKKLYTYRKEFYEKWDRLGNP